MGVLHLPIGPVGAGKSTWSLRQRALHVDVDTWMVDLFGADPRPSTDVLAWYLERRERVRRRAWAVATDALELGVDVVLELGLVGRAERIDAYHRAMTLDAEVRIAWIDAPRVERRARVLARNAQAGAQVVSEAMFERASDAWEPPEDDEVARYGISRG
ncbi:MAG: AAA family ATPase [Alphaproteobacteria bacterium]|nr:AAA family ATPase [Alphaproteobacteria bacterium]MCB9692552.1 AAA family ATPase [Alphaproteobacteria bacterium]